MSDGRSTEPGPLQARHSDDEFPFRTCSQQGAPPGTKRSRISSVSSLRGHGHSGVSITTCDAARVRVGVLVDLPLSEHAGGHVKCWENLAREACAWSDLVLEIHFIGERGDRRRIDLAPNVRYFLHAPVVDSSRFGFLAGAPGRTDLAPFHPSLIAHLRRYDVIHTTDAHFAFARTAARFSARCGVPLVHSTHTDVPKYSRIFTAGAIQSLCGDGPLSRLLLERLRVHDRVSRSLSRSFESHLRNCSRVLASGPEDLGIARRILSFDRVGRLRRGIDKELFHPRSRDRSWLGRAYGIGQSTFLILFVGRLDQTKSPLIVAEATRALIERGLPLQVMFVGSGAEAPSIRRILGDRATCLGPVAQRSLPPIYASADLFVFPSRTEILPNVVIEAKASGLPVLVARGGGSEQTIEEAGRDGLVIDASVSDRWARAIECLYRDPARLHSMGAAARAHVERSWPSWRQVLAEDVLPAWRSAMVEREGTFKNAPSPAARGHAPACGSRTRRGLRGAAG